MTSQRLRGIVCLTRAQPQSWEVGTVAQLQAVTGVELLGYVHVPQREVPASPLWRAVRPFLFRSHSLRPGAFPASLPLLTQIPEGVDFVLQFGSSVGQESDPVMRSNDRIGLLSHGKTRLGTWSFRPDAGGLGAHFGAEVTSGFLVRCEDLGVLYQGHLKTMRHSPSRNADQLCNEMARWPADVCRRILASGPLTEPAKALSADVNPTNGQALGLAVRTLGNFTANFLDTLFLDAEWNIGIVEQPIQRFLDPAFQPQVTWLPGPTPGRFAADSFIVDWQGRRFLYFEDLDFCSYKGRIWAIELKGTQTVGEPVTIFDLPHHLSYPYLLEHQGALYMIPEASATREVVLYRAVELPARWEKVAVLLKDVPAVDSSVFFHDGRWWLLATQPDYLGDPNAHLYLWFAPDLLGPWQPHPGNPVKVDVRSARPAGPPFVHEGRLYRPAQDCSQTYGGRVVLLEITALSPTAFSEQPVRTLEPIQGSRYPGGLHTLSGWNNVTVLDGKRTIFNRHAFGHAVRRKFGRLFTKLFRRSGQAVAAESHP